LRRKLVILKCAAVILIVLAVVWAYIVVRAQEQLLVNPSFEGGWHVQGASELVLPDGWTLEYRDGSHPWCPSPCNRPEVKPNQEFVVDGKYSMRTFTTFSRGLYVIWQEIQVDPGSWWTFSCKTRIDSNPPGELAAYVGIQPWGGGVFDRQMIWGRETQLQYEWQTVKVTAQAFGGKIKVAMGGNNKWATKGNTLWWDACSLVRAEGPAPDPTPLPTYTPYPTPAPCPTCTPGDGCGCADIRSIVGEEVRKELDRTKLGAQ